MSGPPERYLSLSRPSRIGAGDRRGGPRAMADSLVTPTDIARWEGDLAALKKRCEALEMLISAARSLRGCEHCGEDLPEDKAHKANARYCSPYCSGAAQRERHRCRMERGTVGHQPAHLKR